MRHSPPPALPPGDATPVIRAAVNRFATRLSGRAVTALENSGYRVERTSLTASEAAVAGTS